MVRHGRCLLTPVMRFAIPQSPMVDHGPYSQPWVERSWSKPLAILISFTALPAKRFSDAEAQDAEMTSVDRLGFHLRLKTKDGVRGTRIAFMREVATPAEAREVLVEMVRCARQGQVESRSP